MKNTRERTARWLRPALTLFLLVLLGLTYLFSGAFREEVDRAVGVLASGDIRAVRDYILSYGAWAPVISAFLMVLQALLAFLPSFLIAFANGLGLRFFLGRYPQRDERRSCGGYLLRYSPRPRTDAGRGAGRQGEPRLRGPVVRPLRGVRHTRRPAHPRALVRRRLLRRRVDPDAALEVPRRDHRRYAARNFCLHLPRGAGAAVRRGAAYRLWRGARGDGGRRGRPPPPEPGRRAGSGKGRPQDESEAGHGEQGAGAEQRRGGDRQPGREKAARSLGGEREAE